MAKRLPASRCLWRQYSPQYLWRLDEGNPTFPGSGKDLKEGISWVKNPKDIHGRDRRTFSFQQCQPLLPPTLPPTVFPPVGFLWTLGGKCNPERLFRIAPTTHPVSKVTPADVCSYPISTQALASHLFSIRKRDCSSSCHTQWG